MIKLGTSGFSFPDWKGTVYPPKIKQSEMLEYYEHELGFETCELNYNFYRPPDPSPAQRSERLAGLRRKLSRAVETEDFERAAELRDEIKALEGAGSD